MYISLGDFYFTDNRLVDVADTFYHRGGQALFIDEVHKYPGWAQEIKNVHDFYRDMKIVFSGSSILETLRQHADLSRKCIQYKLPGLSFREFLNFSNIKTYSTICLDDILTRHLNITREIIQEIKPLKYFSQYLEYGYYPFYLENIHTYPLRIEQMLQRVVETDFQFIDGFDAHKTRKVMQLLYILSMNVPFKPNVSKLSERTGIYRSTLVQYLHYLERARLANFLVTSGKSLSSLQKPDKLYLENTNMMHVLSADKPDKGTERETFFLNQVKNAKHNVSLPSAGDFCIDETYTFEVGGRSKTAHQIKDVANGFVAADDIETGTYNTIPLWLFGFLY